MKRFLEGLRQPAAIAHRGGARAYPENTLLAFEQALNIHQMDVLEMDVHTTRDGVLVVHHDATVERCTDGTGPVGSFTLAELRKLDAAARFPEHRGKGVCIPTLEEVLTAFPAARLNIELKHAGPEQQFLDVLAKHSALERVCIGSEHDPVAAKLAELAPNVCRFYPAQSALQVAMGIWGAMELAADPRYDILEVPMVFGGEVVANAAFFEACAKISVPVFVWVVDDPDDMKALVRDGAAGVMTDLPAVLHEVLG